MGLVRLHLTSLLLPFGSGYHMVKEGVLRLCVRVLLDASDTVLIPHEV